MGLKLILYTCLWVLIWMGGGCTKQNGAIRQLRLAEELMDTCPDSAYMLLKQVETKQLSGKQEKARYALLLSQALDKNYVDISSDSIIRVAVTYYQRNGNLKDRAKCFYYQGVVYDNAHQLDTAVASYTRAIYYAEKSESVDILGLAHHAIAHAMYNQKYYNDALLHLSKAHELFKAKGDQKNTLYSAVSTALTLQSLNRTDEACAQYYNAMNIARDQQDTLQINSISRALASLYLENDKVALAKEVLFQSIRKYNDFTYQEYPLLTDIYLREHKLDSAGLYAQAMLQWENNYTGYRKAGLYSLLSLIEEAKKNYMQSLSYLKKATFLSDSLRKIERECLAIELERKYRTGHIQASYKQVKEHNTFLLTSFILSVLVLSLGSYVFFLRRKVQLKNKEEEIQRKNSEINDYIQLIEMMKEENASIEEKCKVAITEFEKSHHRQLNNLLKEKEEIEQNAARFAKTDEYLAMKMQVEQKYTFLETAYQAKIEKLRNSLQDRLLVLGKILDIAYRYDDENLFKSKMGEQMYKFKQNNQIQSLLNDLVAIYSLCDGGLCDCLKHKYNLTEEEVSLCCLVKLGFKTTQISILGAYNVGTLNNKRSVIINKIVSDKKCDKKYLGILLEEIQNGLF